MRKIIFSALFLFSSYSVLKAADEYCGYSYQEDRAVPLLLNYWE
ncbi:putative lipoprotein [Campylobacter upsaliensis]|nr:putative lipoprotein [Campylobacter upsaliensis]